MKSYPLYAAKYYDDFREMVKDAADRYGEKTAVTVYDRKGDERTISYAQLYRDTCAFAEALCERRLNGKHLAIVSHNSYEWLVAYVGTASTGGVAVCIDVEQSDSDIVDMIKRADAEAIMASQDLLSVINPLLADENSNIKLVVVADSDEIGCISFTEFCRAGAKRIDAGSKDYCSNSIDPNQMAAIVYTSGTTCVSKPVMLSHKALLTNASDALAMISPGERCFACLPFFHTYGFNMAVVAPLIHGMNVCINGDLKTLIRDLANFKPDIIMAVPLIAEALHKQIWDGIEKTGKKKLVQTILKLKRFIGRPVLSKNSPIYKAIRNSPIGSLKIIVCGGAFVSKTVAMDLMSFGILMLIGYGITECSPLISVNRNKYFKMSSVGLVLPHYELRIKDGEIQVRGASLMSGYYKSPALTAECMDGDWFKTGDLGYMDKHNHLYITGRKKNLIVLKNGKKISAEEIEQSVKHIKMIKEVVAYGAVSGNSQDDVRLAIMVYPDPKETEGMTQFEVLERLQRQVDQVNEKLPLYKQIQMINIRNSEFEKTSSRKIKRQIT